MADPKPPADPQAWSELARKERKGADPAELVWHTPEGIAVKPLYTAADVAHDARVIRVVAAVGGEVERDREAHLPRGEVGAVEGVRLLGRREARVLADRPRLPGVHRGARAAQEGKRAG